MAGRARITGAGVGALIAFLLGFAANVTPLEPSWRIAVPLYALAGVLAIIWGVLFFRSRQSRSPARSDSPFERTEHSVATDQGTTTTWEETRRGQDATVTPETVAAKVHVPQPGQERPVPFSAPPDAELEISLGHEEFHPFEWKAILLEAKIVIRNKTTKMKYTTRGVRWEIDPPEDGQSSGWMSDIDVLRAREKLKERRFPELHGTIGPLDSIAGWVVMSLPWQPWGGVGGYTVTIEDEIGTKYVLRRDRRGGREKP